ncbi:hypothetical protein K523DRAFT_152312 [Schizophyllum commune Tattone D]|nr:hypothetical protein K523DRAFT_152312 [Schizophyllum commune Tattone D]
MSTDDDQVYRPLGSDDLRHVRFIATYVSVDFVLYGIQITFSAAAIALLARRHGRSRFTLVAISGLLLSSTANTVAGVVFYLVQFPVVIGTSDRAIDALLERLYILPNLFNTINFVLSDVVLIWRAWCLWPDSCILKSVLLLCGCGSVVGGIAEVAWINWPSLYDPYALESNGQFLVRLLPLLMTNIVATALIGTKVLHYRREVKGSLGLLTQRTQAESILLLLLESGLAYILFWVVECTVFFAASTDGFTGGAIFNSIFDHIAGIYPTCVLFAVAGGKTDSLLSAQVSQAMRFGSPPAAHEGAREANTTIDFHLEDEAPVGALNEGSHDSHADNIPGPSSIHGGQSRFASSEGIVEVERETTVM